MDRLCILWVCNTIARLLYVHSLFYRACVVVFSIMVWKSKIKKIYKLVYFLNQGFKKEFSMESMQNYEYGVFWLTKFF
jgi:hypothetical protein